MIRRSSRLNGPKLVWFYCLLKAGETHETIPCEQALTVCNSVRPDASQLPISVGIITWQSNVVSRNLEKKKIKSSVHKIHIYIMND